MTVSGAVTKSPNNACRVQGNAAEYCTCVKTRMQCLQNMKFHARKQSDQMLMQLGPDTTGGFAVSAVACSECVRLTLVCIIYMGCVAWFRFLHLPFPISNRRPHPPERKQDPTPSPKFNSDAESNGRLPSSHHSLSRSSSRCALTVPTSELSRVRTKTRTRTVTMIPSTSTLQLTFQQYQSQVSPTRSTNLARTLRING